MLGADARLRAVLPGSTSGTDSPPPPCALVLFVDRAQHRRARGARHHRSRGDLPDVRRDLLPAAHDPSARRPANIAATGRPHLLWPWSASSRRCCSAPIIAGPAAGGTFWTRQLKARTAVARWSALLAVGSCGGDLGGLRVPLRAEPIAGWLYKFHQETFMQERVPALSADRRLDRRSSPAAERLLAKGFSSARPRRRPGRRSSPATTAKTAGGCISRRRLPSRRRSRCSRWPPAAWSSTGADGEPARFGREWFVAGADRALRRLGDDHAHQHRPPAHPADLSVRDRCWPPRRSIGCGPAAGAALLAASRWSSAASSSSTVYPHNLAFFNALVGGPANGSQYLVDSNLDWGQDLKPLKRWMTEHNVPHINLAYFGFADPRYYQIDCTFLPGSPPWVNPDLLSAPRLPGYVAVSATLLRGRLRRQRAAAIVLRPARGSRRRWRRSAIRFWSTGSSGNGGELERGLLLVRLVRR